jgi:SAM-dependent methyltransferase
MARNFSKMYSRRLIDLLRIKTYDDFHSYLTKHAIDSLLKKIEIDSPSLLAVCSTYKEAEFFLSYPFSEIRITGVASGNGMPSKQVAEDPRVHYEPQNCECLGFESKSYDVVFCKEGLHHLARPVQGLYEMLRVCRHGVIVIEGNDTSLGRVFESFGMTSTYEKNQEGNVEFRDNYVFRWSRRFLESLLNSYYLESGYFLEIHVGWMSTRFVGNKLFALASQVAQIFPGAKGNYMTLVIRPGDNLPPDPLQLVRAGESVVTS